LCGRSCHARARRPSPRLAPVPYTTLFRSTPAVRHISFRPRRSDHEPEAGIITCCSENSRYDPLRGAEVISGPARQPLAAIILERSEEHTSELQSREKLVCRLLLENKKTER